MNELPTPVTREEVFLASAAGKSVSLPTPVTREEVFLAKLAGEDVEIPEPVTRHELFLKAASVNAGSVEVIDNATYSDENSDGNIVITEDS